MIKGVIIMIIHKNRRRGRRGRSWRTHRRGWGGHLRRGYRDLRVSKK
jgi:hypothetical protein